MNAINERNTPLYTIETNKLANHTITHNVKNNYNCCDWSIFLIYLN